jgi:hypothetical protein
VRAKDGVMIVNHEAIGEGGPPNFTGGLAIYDVSQPSTPKRSRPSTSPGSILTAGLSHR